MTRSKPISASATEIGQGKGKERTLLPLTEKLNFQDPKLGMKAMNPI